MDFIPVTYGCGTINEKILINDKGFYITVWSGPEDRREIKITNQLRIIVLNDTDDIHIFVDRIELIRPKERYYVYRLLGDLFHCGVIEGDAIILLTHKDVNMMSLHHIQGDKFVYYTMELLPNLVADEKSNLWYDGNEIHCRVKQGFFPATLTIGRKECGIYYDCFR